MLMLNTRLSQQKASSIKKQGVEQNFIYLQRYAVQRRHVVRQYATKRRLCVNQLHRAQNDTQRYLNNRKQLETVSSKQLHLE